jgi:hypothetical protein
MGLQFSDGKLAKAEAAIFHRDQDSSEHFTLNLGQDDIEHSIHKNGSFRGGADGDYARLRLPRSGHDAGDAEVKGQDDSILRDCCRHDL